SYTRFSEPDRILTGPAPQLEDTLGRPERTRHAGPDNLAQCPANDRVRERLVVGRCQIVERTAVQGMTPARRLPAVPRCGKEYSGNELLVPRKRFNWLVM